MINTNSHNNKKKRNSGNNSNGTGTKSKPPINYLSPNKIQDLKDLFFTNGITSNKAAQLVKVDPKTAKKYFEKWSKQLVDDETHETWIDRNTRVRVRSIEGLADTIYKVSKIQKKFTQRLEKILSKIEFLEKSGKKSTNKEIEKLETKLISYERIVRKNTILESELKQQYDMIQIIPPVKEVVDAEIRKRITDYGMNNLEIQ